MKRRLLLVAAILSLAVANAAEYVALAVGGTNPAERIINLDPQDLVEVVAFSGNAKFYMTLPDGSVSSSVAAYSQAKYVYAGITRIRFLSMNSTGFCVLKITRNGTVTNPSAPSNVAVIPNDAEGDFEVILESSVDLVTWTPANPGTFGGDTPRRFFRTRIVRRN